MQVLLEEGEVIDAATAFAFGLVDELVPLEQLRNRAVQKAEEWAAAGRPRRVLGGEGRAKLQSVNAAESQALAEAFLQPAFLENQYRFAVQKKKQGTARMFWWAKTFQPLLARL